MRPTPRFIVYLLTDRAVPYILTGTGKNIAPDTGKPAANKK